MGFKSLLESEELRLLTFLQDSLTSEREVEPIVMLKGTKSNPYTEPLDGGWGWMIVFHFFLVKVCEVMLSPSYQNMQTTINCFILLSCQWRHGDVPQ